MFGILGSLGLGSQLTIAATLLLGGFYIYRAAALASVVTALVGNAITYVLVVLLAAAGAIGAGWVDPHPGVLLDHLARVAGAASDRGVGTVRRVVEIVRGVIPI